MGETGKRFRSNRDNEDNDGKYQKRRNGNREGSPDGGELVVYRILCPDNVIGSVIGKSGKVINSIRQDTRAKIKVVDPFPGAKERVINVYCYVKDKNDRELDEDDMEPLCPAQDALLKLHSVIDDAIASARDSDNRKQKDKEVAHILIPGSQVANIIGKGGSNIKKLRTKTKANIRVNPKDPADPAHACLMSFDNFVEITGDSEAVKKALFAVSAIQYKFPPKEEISLDADLLPSIIIPSDVPLYPSAGFYPSADPIHSARSAPSVAHAQDIHGYSDTASAWPIYPSSLPVVPGYGGPARSEELVVRVLCPTDRIGRVIGKGGSAIKSVRQESGARVDVDDHVAGSDERVIRVNATESLDDVKSMAVEAVLLLQRKINETTEDYNDEKVTIRLLVPHKVIGCLIGKGGVIINDMRKKTKTDIRISKGEKPKCARDDDELVEVIGKVGDVRDALVQLILRLRDDVLKDREGDRNAGSGAVAAPVADSLYSGSYSSSLSTHSVYPSAPSAAPLSYDQRMETGSGLGMLSSSSYYGYGSLMGGENGYGSIPSYSSKQYGGLSSSMMEMVIPANAVGKVMGKGGANIATIRKISGAVIDVLEPKSSRGERIAQISGTPEQKKSAENLIQGFILAV